MLRFFFVFVFVCNILRVLFFLQYLGSANIEKLAPPLHDVEWNTSYGSRASVVLSADSEEDNSDHSDDSDDSDLSDDDWAFM